jgi:glyoxylase-like metal-dependent hydrolase (beta-lactamase superfamily II)
MTGNPMRYINGYLVAENDGYTLVDCGWKTDDVLAALHDALREVGLTLGDVARVVITHAHFDHYGLAATLMRAGVPELLMHPLEWESARRHLESIDTFDRDADAWITRNGYPASTTPSEALFLHHRSELAKPTRTVEDDERIGRLRAVWTPGHTRGHLCLVDEKTGRMFTGDHVLDPVTPHVGMWYVERGDPVGEYTSSLRKVAAIGATGVLPAHGEPFPDLTRRTDELLAHEAQREAAVIAALEGGADNAGTVAAALPWTRRNRSFAELGPFHQEFAVAETLAHLVHLAARDIAAVDTTTTPIRYTLR